LSDVPRDCESDKSSNDDDDNEFGPSASQKSRKKARLEVSDSDVNIDDDDDLDDGWTKNGLTFTPNELTSVSEVVNRFLGNDFLDILVEQSDLYHAQNANKYNKTLQRL
jgi:hypothetical protein